MGRQGRRPARQSKINRQNNKKERDLIAIVSKNKLVGIWTGDESTSKEIVAPNDRDTRLGAMQLFSEVLDQIPTNEEEILDIKTGIYLLDIVYTAMLNPGDAYADKTISEECRDMILPLRRKWDERCLNCFLVSEKGSSATIVSDGFEWLKELAERKVAETYGVTYEKQQVGNCSSPKLTPEQKMQEQISNLINQKTTLAIEDPVKNAETIKIINESINQLQMVLGSKNNSADSTVSEETAVAN